MSNNQLYSALKSFYFPERLDDIRLGQVPAPVHVRIKPTNLCNYSCWYCAYRTDALELGAGMSEADSLPTAKMFEIVRDIIEMDVKAVTFSGGGEPLLYKPLPDIITALGNAGVKISLLTNGANLQGRFADALGAHATWVRISMDGWDDASHAQARAAAPSDFSKIIANIDAFTRAAPQCVVGVSFIIGEANHRHIVDICQLLKTSGVQHVKVSAAVVANDRARNNAYHAPLLGPVRSQIKRAQALEDANFRIANHYHLMDTRFDKPYNGCPSAKLLTVIGADQSVYTCQDKAYTTEGCLGSIRNLSFKEFWFSDANRQRLQSINPRADCRHHCVSHAKNLNISEFLNLDHGHLTFA